MAASFGSNEACSTEPMNPRLSSCVIWWAVMVTLPIEPSEVHFAGVLKAIGSIGSTGATAAVGKFGSGNDTITGGEDGRTADVDTLSGGGGDDVLMSGQGVVRAGSEAFGDLLSGDGGNDTLIGGDANDLLNGGLDNDSLSGGAGEETLFGENGNDQLFGEGGDDLLFGGDDQDTLHGGDGGDTVAVTLG